MDSVVGGSGSTDTLASRAIGRSSSCLGRLDHGLSLSIELLQVVLYLPLLLILLCLQAVPLSIKLVHGYLSDLVKPGLSVLSLLCPINTVSLVREVIIAKNLVLLDGF